MKSKKINKGKYIKMLMRALNINEESAKKIFSNDAKERGRRINKHCESNFVWP